MCGLVCGVWCAVWGREVWGGVGLDGLEWNGVGWGGMGWGGVQWGGVGWSGVGWSGDWVELGWQLGCVSGGLRRMSTVNMRVLAALALRRGKGIVPPLRRCWGAMSRGLL